jgi:hypothetical protein
VLLTGEAVKAWDHSPVGSEIVDRKVTNEKVMAEFN